MQIAEKTFTSKEIGCTECNWIKQTELCCVCGNPNQTNNDLKQYVYSGFNCDLHEPNPFILNLPTVNKSGGII